MRSRGPDASGHWCDASGSVHLIHRRLAILDPASRSDQPLVDATGRFVITFNGEIYNHRVLREDLQQRGYVFRTTSDTEVILALFARHGPGACQHLDGMFAFAIWDRDQRSLFLARDPYGIKPLYVSQAACGFLFASQVKALLAAGADPAPDPAGLAGFALFGHVPEPFTLYRAIRPLPAGHCMSIRKGVAGEPVAFAEPRRAFSAVSDDPEPALDACRIALRDSVERHLDADTEVGLFLSGGVDSGALLGAMRDARPAAPIRTVTLAFDDLAGTPADETAYAGRIAAHYGAEATIHRVSRTDLSQATPRILDAMDQPTLDGVNTWLVARAARAAGLKVMLSGIGGDELFGGYSTFQTVPATLRVARLPARLPGFGKAARRLGTTVLPFLRHRNPKALAALELGGSWSGAYLLRRGLFMPHELPALLGDTVAREGLARLDPLNLIAQAMPSGALDPLMRVAALESGNYLKNQLLRDADWAGMAHGVEIRTPLVDHRLLRAIAPHLPALLRSGGGKALLASLPRSPLPPEILARPKTGFTVPMASLLAGTPVANSRTTSRAWARTVLAAFAEPERQAA